jgi:hypothetical protein
MATRPRLKKDDVPFIEIFQLSVLYNQTVDNKKTRAKLDVLSGRVIKKSNFSYNPSAKRWEQTGREFLFVFQIKTDPKSYKKQDTIKIHIYPIYFLFKDLSMGLKSPFRWREGSNARPKFAKKGASAKKRLQILNDNIKRGIQFDFFFNTMTLANKFGILYGVDTTNKQFPIKSNPKLIPRFSKHAYFLAEKILIPLLSNPTKLNKLLNKPVVNK